MSTPAVRKAVIPAAGLGTRFMPATKVIPKELFPLLAKPAIHYAVEEAVASGISSVVIVVNERKSSIRDYFRPDPSLEDLLRRQGKTTQLEMVSGLTRRCDIEFVLQPEPAGLGHAIACARKSLADEPFVVILPDVVILSAVPCTRQLLDCFQRHAGCVLATREIDSVDYGKFGMLAPLPPPRDPEQKTFRVADLVEKPARQHAPSPFGIFGRYVLQPGVLDYLVASLPGANGEIELTAALARYAHDYPVYGYVFSGAHFDIGDEIGLLQASIELALQNPVLRQRLLDFLQSRMTEQAGTIHA